MATYRSTPGNFRNGTNHAADKAMLDANETKRRTRIHVIRDPWRETHPRRPNDQQQSNDTEKKQKKPERR